MLRTKRKLKIEKEKLADLIDINDYDLQNSKVIEQSEKVDKIIVKYHELESNSPK